MILLANNILDQFKEFRHQMSVDGVISGTKRHSFKKKLNQYFAVLDCMRANMLFRTLLNPTNNNTTHLI